MPDYTITRELWNTALEEMRVQWRKKSPKVSEERINYAAETSLNTAWSYAIRHHDQFKLQPVALDLPPIKGMEEFQQNLLKQHENIFKGIQNQHRASLIHLFTMEDGLSQKTAEKIVDEHILIHK